jgi:hypothetical protein
MSANIHMQKAGAKDINLGEASLPASDLQRWTDR